MDVPLAAVENLVLMEPEHLFILRVLHTLQEIKKWTWLTVMTLNDCSGREDRECLIADANAGVVVSVTISLIYILLIGERLIVYVGAGKR